MNLNHLVVAPIVLPALTAGLLLMLGARPQLARGVGLASTALLLVVSVLLAAQAASGAYQVYALGDWPAPFGIVMVLDRLSAMLVAVTALVALAALAYAVQGWDSRGRHFHALFQFQLMGINGAFLTGDLFNLFVFFEVLLIASYCLLLHGLGERRLRAAVHYVAVNLTGSAVFLLAVGVLYSVTGTLNMAHLAERVAQAPESDIALIRGAGLMLLGVFAVKAALFPLYFWLPSAYSNASAPVAALFAVMTKIGVYAIVRFTTVIFGAEDGAGADLTAPWLLPVALFTLALAAFGALAARRFAELVAYLTVASVGTMLIAVTAGEEAGLAGALFYLIHSTLIVSALFLLAELLARERGTAADTLSPGPALRRPALLGLAFLLGAAIIAGLPLSSGFLAKLMILKSAIDTPVVAWVWGVILGTSLVTIIGCARAGSIVLWNTAEEKAPDASPVARRELLPLAALLACSILLVVFARPIKQYVDAAAAQALTPAGYVAAVLDSTPDRAPRAIRGEHRR
jgi:multicomponent K+:H+ antiporter subunit D